MASVELRNISKRFGSLRALVVVWLALPGGRVHGVLGENGAGKSTLMNVLYGLLRADGGQIAIDGKAVSFRSPADAIAAGVGMVHQHFMLAGAMSVLDNVLLGDRRQRRLLDRRTTARKLEELSQRLNLPIDPQARVEALSVGRQQRVEILKALFREARTLILDEPTAVLTPRETDELLNAMSRLRDEGKSVVFISHKLSEVLRVCDDITVLRRGKVAWSGERCATSADDLARHMVGSTVAPVVSVGAASAAVPSVGSASADAARSASAEADPTGLALDRVSTVGLHDVSFTVGSQILGVAGVDGNGQQELAEVLVGLRRATGGRILLGGREIKWLSLPARTELGVAHVPNDRKHEGLVLSMTVAENLALKHHDRAPFSRMGVLSHACVRRVATELARRFDIRAAGIEALVGTLSGGNQQKVVLARELGLAPPRLIVATNPTRGLDISATRAVHDELRRQRDGGCAVVLISSELEELLSLSDRLGVLYRGRLTMTAFPDETVERIGRLMAGVSDH